MAILFDGRFITNGFSAYNTDPEYAGATGWMELAANGVNLTPPGMGGGAITNAGIPNHVTLVADPAGSGEQVMRTRVTRSDAITSGSKRAEIGLASDPLPYPMERWYSWSIYLPSDWQQNNVKETIWQIHNAPDTAPAEASVAIPPPFEFNTTVDGRILVQNASDINATSTSNSSTVRTLFYTPLDLGKWQDWCLHIVWSATAGAGSIEFYKNRRLVFSENNIPNTYNDATARGGAGPYMRMGTYYWSYATGTVEERIAYYKGFRVGDAASSFAEVTGTSQLETVSLKNGSLL